MDKTIKNTMKPLSEVMNDLKKQGHQLDFTISKEGILSTLDDPRREITPNEVSILETYRFEGMSNPSDNSILYLLKIRSGETGTLVNSYGAESTALIDKFIKHLK